MCRNSIVTNHEKWKPVVDNTWFLGIAQFITNTNLGPVEEHISRTFRHIISETILRLTSKFPRTTTVRRFLGPIVVYTYILPADCATQKVYHAIIMYVYNTIFEYCTLISAAPADGLLEQRRGRTVTLLFGPKRVGFPTPVQCWQICVRPAEFVNCFFTRLLKKKKGPLRVLLLFNGITELKRRSTTRSSCLRIVVIIIIYIAVYCGVD